MKAIFEENWSMLDCDQCKHKGDRCRRLGGTKYRFYKPWFATVGKNQKVCKEFEPMEYLVWLRKNWNGYEDYYDGEIVNGFVTLLDDTGEVGYRVSAIDFINGTIFNEDGDLKWIERFCYSQSRSNPIGWKLVIEKKR